MAAPITAAEAQTIPRANGINLLNPFLTLPNSTFKQAFDISLEINRTASPSRIDQAVYDAKRFDYSGFGTKISKIMDDAFQDASSPLNPTVKFVDFMGSTRVGADTTWLKQYYGVINTYGTYYGLTVPGVPNAEGNPRPFQVSDQIRLDPRYGAGTSNSASYPSGHSMNANVQTLLYAVMAPELYQPLLARSTQSQNSRIILGVHTPLDVIAGRLLATQEVVNLLNNNPGYLLPGEDFAKTVSEFSVALHTSIQAKCGLSLAACSAANPGIYGDAAQNKANYTYSLTYGLAPIGRTDLAPVVPTGAEVLLATRFPYLSGEQRRDVLATTEIGSGQPLDNGEGWARLNLYAAADGYGAFNRNVTVTMDAAQGGFSASDTWRNDISGQGSLTKAGTGTLVLTGTNTYAGGTTINGGTLVGHAQAFGSGAIQDNANLVIDQASDATMANAIAGSGSLTKLNGGTLTLTGDSSLGGSTAVLGGRLAVNGRLAGSVVTIGQDASLGGTGTVGGVVAQAGATVAPGNSIGTLNVAGNASFAQGATFQVEANAAGQSDRLAATGTATLAGGTVRVLAQAGAYDPRTQYAILTAAGGVSGSFAGVTSNLAFLTPSLRYKSNEVDLTLTRNDTPFAAIAQSRNQASVASAIQAAGAGSRLYDRTIGLTTPEAVGAFQALTGDIHAGSVSAAYETAFFVREAILDRLRWSGDLRDYGNLPATYTADLPGRAAPVAPVPVRVLDPRVFGLWGQGFGSFGQARADGNAATLSRDTAGFVLGADMRLENGIKLGVAGGYTHTNLDTSGQLSGGTIESGFGGVYGGYEAGPFALRLGAVYADNALRLRRSVIFPGVSEAEGARYGGSTLQGFGEIGYRFVLGNGLADRSAGPVSVSYIEPFVGGAYVGIDRDRFAETGGVAALTGASRLSEIPTLTAGLRTQTSFDLGLGAPVELHGLVGYRRAFGDVIPTTLLAFGAGPSFVTAGIPITRDALIASAGLDLRVSAAATLGVSYTGQVGSRAEDHAVKGNFTYRF